MQYTESGLDEIRIMRGEYELDGTEVDFESKYFFNYWLHSKVFTDQGNKYIWFLYKKESTVQPTYFLYDVEQNLISKVLSGNGGNEINPNISDGYPNHNLARLKQKSDNKWLFPVQKKGRLLTNEDNLLFSTLGIESVELDFTSQQVFLNQEAANNLHIVGGMLQMYDGVSLVEHGFNLYPEIIQAGITTSGSSGIAAGTRQYVAVFKWTDNQGQIHRSAPSIPVTYTNGSAVTRIFIPAYSLGATKKSGAKMEVYRTEDAGTIFYKVGETDVDSTTSLNDVEDTISDGDLIDNELLYTTGGVLENIAPTTCSIITHHKNRIFLAGLEDKNQVQYSKLIVSGSPVQFNDTLAIDMPENGGIITGLASLDDKLIIFKRSAIYTITGDGPNNLGQQNSFSDPQIVASDVGCTDSNSIVLTPEGLMFKSSKGIYLLSRGLQVQYVGASVEDFNSNTITSATLLDKQNEVRFTTNSENTLVYNYLFKRWSVFDRYEGRDSLVHEDRFTFLSTDGSVKQEF